MKKHLDLFTKEKLKKLNKQKVFNNDGNILLQRKRQYTC